jgi:DNA-damage-inducible protein D
MNTEERLPAPNGVSPFERIRRTNAAGAEFWSSRDFAQVLGCSDYRNFEQAMKRARTACFKSDHRVEDHFGEITEMIEKPVPAPLVRNRGPS